MMISEKGTKFVFISLVCLSLGALLGLEIQSQTQMIEEINASVTDIEPQAEDLHLSEDRPSAKFSFS